MTSTTERTTRKPTGLPSWPIGLLAGAEKTGKTYAAAAASSSELVSRTFWLGIGEDDPDEYGSIPGADFDIVTHDGTYKDFRAAVEWAATQPSPDERPTLLVIDSGTRLWDLLCDGAQEEANARARRKAARSNRPARDEDATINMDLWNVAKQRWTHVMDAVREHNGPTLITARLDIVAVVGGDGQPTGEKTTKIKAEKSLPFDVGFIVEFPAPGEAVLTGVRSLKVRAGGTARKPFPDFTVDKLWRELGLAGGEVGERAHHHAGQAAPTTADLLARLDRAENIDDVRGVWRAGNDHGLLDELDEESGLTLRATIDAIGKQFIATQPAAEQQQPAQVPA